MSNRIVKRSLKNSEHTASRRNVFRIERGRDTLALKSASRAFVDNKLTVINVTPTCSACSPLSDLCLAIKSEGFSSALICTDVFVSYFFLSEYVILPFIAFTILFYRWPAPITVKFFSFSFFVMLLYFLLSNEKVKIYVLFYDEYLQKHKYYLKNFKTYKLFLFKQWNIFNYMTDVIVSFVYST